MKRFKIGVLLLCLLGVGWGLYFKFSPRHKDNTARIALRIIPPDDQWVLDYFFRQLLLREGGAYVLNGTKPVALGGFGMPSLQVGPFFGWQFFSTNVLLQKGYEAWKKYQHLFPHPPYLVLCLDDNENEMCQVVLINKRRFVDVVEENIEDFKAVLGPEITATFLLNELEKEEQTLYHLLHHHSGLLGIVLGYGKHNAWLFYQRDQLNDQIDSNQFIPKRLDLIEAEWNAFHEKLRCKSPNRTNKLFFARLPAFAFDSQHVETQILLEQYRRQRKELTLFYARGNFLENVLQRLEE